MKKPLNAFLGEIFEGQWDGHDGGEYQRLGIGWEVLIVSSYEVGE